MTAQEIVERLKENANEENRKGMAKYGINTDNALGVNVQTIREIAKEIGTDHELAEALWKTKIHEARILATIIADHLLADNDLLDNWVEDLNSWDICDQFCNNLVINTPFALMKILQWCVQDETFIKRAGFATMANYALKTPEIREKDMEGFFSLIINECGDSRNYVQKAVSWALRNIGKRDMHYNRKAVKIAKQLKTEGYKSADKTASEALKELQKSELHKKLKAKETTSEEI